MIPIYYKSSEGVVVNLIETPYRMLTETELLNSEWEPTTTGENFPRITRLDKKLVSPNFKIRVTGNTKTEMANNLEHLESVFDRDCFLNQMGRLYIGDFYRECFITGITHGKVFEKTHTVAEYVATSNDSYWVNNKTLTFSGYGSLVGEMADKVLISANYNNEGIIVEPLSDNKAHVKWNGTPYDNNSYWFKLDMGSVMDIDSISGLKLKRPSYTPLSVDVQTSDGEVVDDARTQSVTTDIYNDPILVDDFTTITIDDFGESGWGARLQVRGYFNQEMNMYTTQECVVGDTIDCTDFVYVAFRILYLPELSTTVKYTVNEEQWTTIETITVPGDSETEIELSNLTCRYVRLKGGYFGNGFDEDLSVVSGEETSDRDIIAGGYELNNLTRFKTVYSVVDASKKGYILFDAVGVGLKHIYSTSNTGTAKLQGLNNNTWSDIVTITTNMDSVFDNHYDKLRIEVDGGFNSMGLRIMVQTDARLTNGSYAPSDAIIKIKGAWSNPYVVINGTSYGAKLDLLQDHTLVIDTKKKTVRDYSDTDTYENVYANRLETAFEQIESGVNEVDWSGDAEEIQITLEQARSIPKWN